MGKYDKIFSSEEMSEESLSPEEAVAAVAVVTAVADSSLEDVDVEFIADTLWGFDVFEDYSDDDLLEMVDKLLVIAEDEGLGPLFNTAYESLSDELVVEAFAAGVSVLVDEDDLRIPKKKMALLTKLQEALEIGDEQAKEIIDEVITAFEEAEAEEFALDEEETLLQDSNLQVYESPNGNFTVAIPVTLQQGARIQATEGLVSFSDDFGSLFRIDYDSIDPQEIEQLKSGQQQYLQSMLLNKYVPDLVADLPNAAVEYTEYLPDAMSGAFFALVDMPEGSMISQHGNNGTASKIDVYRGLLTFIQGDFLYVASCQRSFFNGETPGSIEQEALNIKQKILEFVDTIEFT